MMTKRLIQHPYLKYHHQLSAELLHCVTLSGSSQQKSTNALNFPMICCDLATQILTNTYHPRPYHHFAITEPKLREVYAPDFRDRIVQMWVALQFTPMMERRLINDTYANRKSKGTLSAICKAQKCMRQPHHSWGLQLDIYSYFNCINKATLINQLCSLIDRSTLSPLRKWCLTTLTELIVQHDATAQPNQKTGKLHLLNKIPHHKRLQFQNTVHTGLPIGSVTSQLFGNFYLNDLDHYIKHNLSVKGYIRYMDDLLLLADSPEKLQHWKIQIERYLHSNLHLKLHPYKTQISSVDNGFDYLGFRVYPHHKHIRKSTIDSLKNRLRYFNTLLTSKDSAPKTKPSRGLWSKKDIHQAPFYTQLKAMQSTVNSYYGLLNQANHCKLRQSLYHCHFGELKRYLLPNNAYYEHFTIKKGLHFNKTTPENLCWPETQDA
ncbi:RNA-directed DNA polymerase [Vibrio campbellii]|uniref:RNA-directed DNA polymerase n=1 Tax=Vibrio campbellii TaxID=680 RepID=UPI001F2A5FBE|nr:RNA-directed DNA polymerase [Vibrio campbellii]MCE7732871.1 RNA-directed DNA polymerase [Vibrio campbellii]